MKSLEYLSDIERKAALDFLESLKDGDNTGEKLLRELRNKLGPEDFQKSFLAIMIALEDDIESYIKVFSSKDGSQLGQYDLLKDIPDRFYDDAGNNIPIYMKNVHVYFKLKKYNSIV